MKALRNYTGLVKKDIRIHIAHDWGEIIPMFPGFKPEFEELLSDLEQVSRNSWWKDERDAEVHIDASKLYELRHEEINESKEVMEAWQLMNLFNRFNNLTARLHKVYLNYMVKQFIKQNGYIPNISAE